MNAGMLAGSIVVSMLLLGAAAVGIATDARGSLEGPETAGLLPDSEEVSRLVKRSCGDLYSPASSPDSGDPGDEAAVAFALCSVLAFIDHRILERLGAPCGLGEVGTFSLALAEPYFSEKAICFSRTVDQQGVSHQIWALVEALSYVDQGASSCSLECGRLIDSSLLHLLQSGCQETPLLCREEVIQAEHIATELPGECKGEWILRERLPESSRFEVDYAGSGELFIWRENTTKDPPGTGTWGFRCEAEAQIIGEATGGFMRELILDRDGIGPTICQYDGFMETGCTDSFKSIEIVGVTGGTYDADDNSGALPPATMTLEHEPGWVLLNEGQGSTKAFQTLDPIPAEIPGKIIDVQVNYTITSDEGPGETTEAAAPQIGLVVLLMALYLFVRRR